MFAQSLLEFFEVADWLRMSAEIISVTKRPGPGRVPSRVLRRGGSYTEKEILGSRRFSNHIGLNGGEEPRVGRFKLSEGGTSGARLGV